MSNPVSLVLIEVYRDDIKPTFSILEIVLHQESLSDLFDLSLLGRSNRFFRKAEIRAFSRFDLDEDQCIYVQGNDVYFSPELAKVLGENLVFFIF